MYILAYLLNILLLLQLIMATFINKISKNAVDFAAGVILLLLLTRYYYVINTIIIITLILPNDTYHYTT